jgi:hypothetical protein
MRQQRQWEHIQYIGIYYVTSHMHLTIVTLISPSLAVYNLSWSEETLNTGHNNI